MLFIPKPKRRSKMISGGSSRFNPYATVCTFILLCVCLDLYQVVIFHSWRMLLLTARDGYARNGAGHHVRM